jgi:hypothetical protein
MEGSRILFTFYIMFNIQVFIRHVRGKIAIINKASIQPAYVTSRMQSRNLTQSVSESLDLFHSHLLYPPYHLPSPSSILILISSPKGPLDPICVRVSWPTTNVGLCDTTVGGVILSVLPRKPSQCTRLRWWKITTMVPWPHIDEAYSWEVVAESTLTRIV